MSCCKNPLQNNLPFPNSLTCKKPVLYRVPSIARNFHWLGGSKLVEWDFFWFKKICFWEIFFETFSRNFFEKFFYPVPWPSQTFFQFDRAKVSIIITDMREIVNGACICTETDQSRHWFFFDFRATSGWCLPRAKRRTARSKRRSHQEHIRTSRGFLSVWTSSALTMSSMKVLTSFQSFENLKFFSWNSGDFLELTCWLKWNSIKIILIGVNLR